MTTPPTSVPAFSVVIPTHNRANRIGATLRSVLAQTCGDFELLVMDDGSTDETERIVSSFEDPRIVYEWAGPTGGPAGPRNRGMSRAKAPWICLLDSDDLWEPVKLERLQSMIAEHPEADVFCHHEWMENRMTGSREVLHHGPAEDGMYRRMLLEGNRLSPSATTMRKAFLDAHGLAFDPGFVIVEDFDLWLRMAENGARFHFIEETLGTYVLDDGGISTDHRRYIAQLLNLYRRHAFEVQEFEPDRRKLWRMLRTGAKFDRLTLALARHDWLGALPHIASCFASSPAAFLAKLTTRLRPESPRLATEH